MEVIGRHIILELWGCNPGINDVPVIERAMRETIEAVRATLIDLRVYPFSPQGVTGVAILSESHLMIHTWPEHGYAAIDIFTCGMHTDPEQAIPVLRRAFAPDRVQVLQMDRGLLIEENAHGVPT